MFMLNTLESKQPCFTLRIEITCAHLLFAHVNEVNNFVANLSCVPEYKFGFVATIVIPIEFELHFEHVMNGVR